MYFIIKNKYNWADNYFKAKIIRAAIRRIRTYKIGSVELALNEYFIKKHHITLKKLCTSLITDLKFYKSSTDEYILKFKTKEIGDLATFITFGDGNIQGSKILKVAFAWE